MNYIALLEAAIRRQSFRLHPGLDPAKYEMTNTMRDAIDKWRAYAYVGATYTDRSKSIKKGDMTGVGYVMISLKDDTIIPVARSDEHHRGMDLLHDLSEMMYKKKSGQQLNPRDYVPIFTSGSNYIYSAEEIPNMLNALTKYLSYGGRDGPLQGAYDMRHMIVNSSDFVAAKGQIDVSAGKLAPAGEKIFESFVALAEVFRAARNSPQQASLTGRAFQAAIKFAAQLRPFLSYLAIDDYDILYKPEILGGLKKEGDLQKLEEAFFGFHGLKNNIHNALRSYVARQQTGEKNFYTDDNIKALWGDVDLAVDKLGTI